MSILDDLARVREAGGHDPLPDPTQIAGFGPNDPPVPPYNPREFDRDLPTDWLDPDLDADDPRTPKPSPLIPKKVPAVAAPAPLLPVSIDLIVADRKAVWKDRKVELLEAEEKAIRAIVLKAIHREVAADLVMVEAPKQKRTRRTQVKVYDVPAGGEAHSVVSVPARRRPGRPKKNAV